MFEVSFWNTGRVKVRGFYTHDFPTYEAATAAIEAMTNEAIELGAYEASVACRDHELWFDLAE